MCFARQIGFFFFFPPETLYLTPDTCEVFPIDEPSTSVLLLTSDKNFGAHIDRTLKKIRSTILKSFRENEIDLTPEQWVLLSELYQNDGISQKMLAEGSYKDAPTTSRIIDLLARKDLLRRDEVENNRRQYQIYISKKGKKMVEKAMPLINEIRVEGWKGLNDKDYNSLLRILDTLATNFDSLQDR